MKKGFTIIEVMLFLAITSFTAVAFMVGTGSSISRQRYNDSVQDFTEFLRKTYSSATNVQNSSPTNGRSETAIYGKLLTFGEEDAGSKIYIYDVIGDVVDVTKINSSTDALVALSSHCDSEKEYCAHADVVMKKDGNYILSGNEITYTPQWDAIIEKPDKSQFKGAILIVRSPTSGTLSTFVMEGSTLEIQKTIHGTYSRTLAEALAANKFSQKEVDFCVASEDAFAFRNNRRNVRLAFGGRNSTAVELISLDNEDNKCL